MKLNFHKNHQLLFGTILSGFLLLSLLIAVYPAMTVQEENKPLPDSEPLTDLQQKGLDVYVSEGCMYCHTQQVRPIEMDENWGRPSAPGDYAYIGRQDVWRQTPAVLGSARTGPDLSNVGSRQPSEVWHYMHLYNPRSVVKESIMPSYPWLFEIKDEPGAADTVVSLPDGLAPESGTVVATEKAEALVAYLLTLKQVEIKAGRGGTGAAEQVTSSETEEIRKAADGSSIYANNCAACHQTNGHGVPGVFPPMKDDPVVTAEDPTEHIKIILNGLQGKTIDGVEYQGAMQPFRSMLSDEEVAAVVNHERTSWGNDAPTVTAEDVRRIRQETGTDHVNSED